MNKKNLQLFLILGSALSIVIFTLYFHLSPSKAAVIGSGSVTVADLQKAGFAQVKQLTPLTSGRFSGPNLYFSVSDKVTAVSSEAPNIVMAEDYILPYQLSSGALFNYGLDNHDFSIAGGSGKEATMADGRVAINFIKNSHYDVLIGPNKMKVESLISTMADKIK
jgi:hypothetical protein